MEGRQRPSLSEWRTTLGRVDLASNHTLPRTPTFSLSLSETATNDGSGPGRRPGNVQNGSSRIHSLMLKPAVQVKNENGILVAEFWDCLRLDPGPVQELRTKFEAHLRAGGQPFLVIDLLGVGFAGSASLGNFVALHRIAKPKNGRLIFCNTDEQVLEVFRVIKLEPLFSFVADRKSAVALAQSLAGNADGSPPADALPATPAPTAPAKPSPARDTPKPSTGIGLLHSSRRKKLS